MFEYCFFKVKLFILIFSQKVPQSLPTFYLWPISSSDELRLDKGIITAFCWESGFPDNVIKAFLEKQWRHQSLIAVLFSPPNNVFNGLNVLLWQTYKGNKLKDLSLWVLWPNQLICDAAASHVYMNLERPFSHWCVA